MLRCPGRPGAATHFDSAVAQSRSQYSPRKASSFVGCASLAAFDITLGDRSESPWLRGSASPPSAAVYLQCGRVDWPEGSCGIPDCYTLPKRCSKDIEWKEGFSEWRRKVDFVVQCICCLATLYIRRQSSMMMDGDQPSCGQPSFTSPSSRHLLYHARRRR